jgi:hypothetical protein
VANLRKYARGKDCQVRIPGVCNFDPETTVLAHVRLTGISGMGIKAPDLLGAHCCSACHEYCDTHNLMLRDFLIGVMRTQAQLIKDGIVKW